jgi:hypothetical protein
MLGNRYLFTSEFGPFSPLEHLVELEEVLSAEEVDEPIANIALVFDVAGQIEEIIGIAE